VDQALRRTVLPHVTEAIRRSLSLPDLGVTLETHLSEDLELDSLDVVEITMSLEEAFDIEFPQDAVLKFNIVSDIVDYLSNRVFRDTGERLLERVA